MADRSFEYRLERLFAEHPAYPDAALFAARVERRLDRGWTVRSAAIGAAGLVGGGVAIVQALGSNLIGRLTVAGQESAGMAGRRLDGLADAASALSPVLRALPLGAETLWLIAGLAALAAGLLTTRLIERG